jgi:ElaB/YqjD/DUF883 family membrane-anchored ribosome-binding protein
MKTTSTREAISNGKHAASASVKSINDGVARELRNFIADIEDLIESSGAMSAEGIEEVKETISERVAAAKQSIQEFGGTIDETARKTATKTNEYVHEQPWKSIGIGAAAGVLLGLVLSHHSKASS